MLGAQREKGPRRDLEVRFFSTLRDLPLRFRKMEPVGSVVFFFFAVVFFHPVRLRISSPLPVALVERAAGQRGCPAFASSVTGHLLVARRRVVPALVPHTHILGVARTHGNAHMLKGPQAARC